eukprot:TRINITY_DN5785_c0_g1_i2.p1 TRINITY_DN5785_c0_g1~~TRINITY_DN5785_c0_g1_i2.p1  ORF type:complete len:205 (-),score=29.39 TRINITY_DN5785_c0_g1_i2:97-711(-)
MYISQSITNPATLVWLMRDQTLLAQVYPTAWPVLNFTSSSLEQTITFYHQLAIGITPLSGTSYTVTSWIETDFSMSYDNYRTNFSPAGVISPPDVAIINHELLPVTYGIGFSQLGNGAAPSTFDVTGVTTVLPTLGCDFNSKYKAVKYKVYCNLPTSYTQGQVIFTSLPGSKQLISSECMWDYPADTYFLLSESGGEYTYPKTA